MSSSSSTNNKDLSVLKRSGSYSAYSYYHEGSVKKKAEGTNKILVSFSTTEEIGALQTALGFFTKHNLSLDHIESKPSVDKSSGWTFSLTLPYSPEQKEVKLALDELSNSPLTLDVSISSEVTPWFPRSIRDLDGLSQKVLSYGEELSSDHPGFADENYRKRRLEICAMSRNYKHGKNIPRIKYLPKEIETWGVIYKQLKQLYSKNACSAHCRVFPLLEQFCGYSENNIPQLEDISNFLKSATGWSLRPVTGLLTPRDFLNGLAFRVFHSTQYIRHYSKPLYTPEPDVCHELLGHVPLFADPDFADFSQEIGLASLGASDQDIEKLATVYWFTVEFGLCKEGDKIKAFGAGLLSSFGELEYCLTDKPKLLPFEPTRVIQQKYPITEYQPVYFVAESFDRMKVQMKQFASTLSRPFSLHYNPYTQSVTVLDSKKKLATVAKRLQYELGVLASALSD